ncbi:MAG: hypothetical protein IT249_07355 [Chitinophagaceae bacterium]|nr:hypothetical protein [Chitinophagaceae bacterium]
MNTANIRKQLQRYLEIADDKKVRAIYTMMEEEIKGADIEYSEALKAELDQRYESYKTGKGKLVTHSESKKRINNLIKKIKQK